MNDSRTRCCHLGMVGNETFPCSLVAEWEVSPDDPKYIDPYHLDYTFSCDSHLSDMLWNGPKGFTVTRVNHDLAPVPSKSGTALLEIIGQ